MSYYLVTMSNENNEILPNCCRITKCGHDHFAPDSLFTGVTNCLFCGIVIFGGSLILQIYVNFYSIGKFGFNIYSETIASIMQHMQNAIM